MLASCKNAPPYKAVNSQKGSDAKCRPIDLSIINAI
jgi:hypothetical protein